MGTEASHRAGEELVVAGIEDGEEEVAAEFRDGVCTKGRKGTECCCRHRAGGHLLG